MENNTLHMTTEGLPFPPSVNAYLGHRVVKKGRANIVMAYTKQPAKVFQKKFGEYLDELIAESNWDKEVTRGTHFYLDCTMYMPRRNIDENNLYKVLVDCLNDVAIVDDKHLVTRTQAVYYDFENPHVQMYLHPVGYSGIFPTETEENFFERHCSGCTRFRNGRCSILLDSKDGKLREEIDYKITNDEGFVTHENITCTKYKEKK